MNDVCTIADRAPDAPERIFVIERGPRRESSKSLMMIELGKPSEKLVSVLNYDGTPITADEILNQIKKHISDLPAVADG